MTSSDAEHPQADGGREYHLQTRTGDLAPVCLLVGDPERATMIAEKHLQEAVLVGDHRGLKSYTGKFQGERVSVVTTGMGGASAGIVLPEAVRSGARAFIHVGSCGSMQAHAKVGDVVICSAAVRHDGASSNWAPIEWPASADYRVVNALALSAERAHVNAHVGIGVTTACFYEGQARPDDTGFVADRIMCRHKELTRRGALFYAMEDAALFVWCSTHGNVPIGSVNAVYANRQTGDFTAGAGMEAAIKTALGAVTDVACALAKAEANSP